jgi:hypothetical protein
MSVATTSREAYKEHRATGKVGAQAQKILDKMQPGVEYSRRELVELTGLELSSICGRVNELLGSGLIQEGKTRPCRVTGKSVHPVYRNSGLFDDW